jgi:hypothetical protein
MRWEEVLLDLFDDLEQQAEGLHLAERDAEVADRSRAEYASVDLAARLHASSGGCVRLLVSGLGRLDGRVSRLGADWCLLSVGSVEWLVRFAALTAAQGLSRRSLSEHARPVTARLGLGSALRGLAESGGEVTVTRLDGSRSTGLLGRVGADFLELVAAPGFAEDMRGEPGTELVPFAHLAAVRGT